MNILHFHIPTIVSNSNLPRKCKQSAIRELGAVKFLSTEKLNSTGSAAWRLAWPVDACRMQCSTGLTRQVRRVTMVIILNSTSILTYQLQQVCMTKYNKPIRISYRLLLSSHEDQLSKNQNAMIKDILFQFLVQLQTCIITYHS